MEFTQDTYYQEKFLNLSLSGERLRSIEFEECEFTGCSFIDCTFEKCKLIDCTFTDCTISAINPMNSWVSDTKFTKSKVMGCDWTRASQVHGMEFTDCQLNYSNFSGMKIPGIKMINCQAKEVDFAETDLSEATFSGTDFERSIFSRTNLAKASFTGAVNYSIDPRNNTLKKTHFSMPEALSLLSSFDIVID